MLGRALAVTLVAWCASARADGLVIGSGSPRAIGRAGVGTASDDGGGALLVNPAAMARREAKRAQVGVSFLEDSVDWLAATNAPDARDQAGSSTLPFVAAEAGFDDWVIGLGAMTSTVSERAFPAPGSLPPNMLGNAFLYRYNGIAGTLRRDTVTAGVARRLGDSVALGLAVGASRVTVDEERRVWAGFAGRETIGDGGHDVDIAIDAHDDFVPNAIAGVLIAPSCTSIELAASVDVSGSARVDGGATAFGTTDGATPLVAVDGSPITAHTSVRAPLSVRAGARWLGGKWIAELGGDLWVFPDSAEATSWELQGLTVIDSPTRPMHRTAPLGRLPSRISQRTHGAVRAAVDVEVIDGFLWVTGGYAFATAGTSEARLSPTFGDLGGHTAALGVEGSAGGFTFTLGWSHTWSIARGVSTTAWRLDNPFGTGDAPVYLGRYDGAIDLVGLELGVELDPE